MKKSSIYIIFVLVVVAAIVAGLAVRYVPSVVPYWQCSEVYKRYSKVEGVCASYIKDYRINDTLTVGVTLLEATDSAGWEYLKQAFAISTEMVRAAEKIPSFDVWIRQTLKDHPEIRYDENDDSSSDTKEVEIVAISISKQEICVLHTQNEQERDAVFYKKIESNL
jgi:hypothetical protein